MGLDVDTGEYAEQRTMNLSKYRKYFPGKEWLTVICVTVGFFIVAVLHLGTLDFPSSDWQAGYNEDIRLDLGTTGYVDEVFILIQNRDTVRVESYSGYPESWILTGSIDDKGKYRQWLSLRIRDDTRYIRLLFRGKIAVGEIAVFAGGQRLHIERIVNRWDEDVAPELMDEQASVQHIPTYENGTYFDEVYFVQTAEEHLHLEEPYEWSHPPLGKLIIASGILALGSNPFAWRITGVLFATAMIPLIYLMACRLFKNRWYGVTASLLLAVEFMHYTQARLATGETFLFCFLMLMFFFSLRYLQTPPAESGGRDLFLSLLFFGMAFSVKWTAIYGFIAICVLLALFKWRHGLRRAELTGLLAGVIAAAVFYVATYIPYFLAGHGLGDMIELQFSMFGYHSGLEAAHHYSSPWWSWPLMLHPLLLYSGEIDGQPSMIVALGNPVIWWLGIAGMLYVLWNAARHRETTAAFIAVAFLALWLLYAPLPRLLFIYHYYPAVLFMILGITYCLNRLHKLWITVPYLFLAVIAFAFFFPVISGEPMGTEYWDIIRDIIDWGSRFVDQSPALG
jgi:dolichyl-phosphate-mannose-protein mannosyltransferase